MDYKNNTHISCIKLENKEDELKKRMDIIDKFLSIEYNNYQLETLIPRIFNTLDSVDVILDHLTQLSKIEEPHEPDNYDYGSDAYKEKIKNYMVDCITYDLKSDLIDLKFPTLFRTVNESYNEYYNKMDKDIKNCLLEIKTSKNVEQTIKQNLIKRMNSIEIFS